MTSRCFFSVIILVSVFLSPAAGDSSYDCVYTLYVQTGLGFKAGTDSKISVVLGDPHGQSVWVPNLKTWGLMGPTHDYYERGNLDIFSGRGPCIDPPLCRLNLTSDGSGSHHGWYCDFIEITTTGPHKECSQTIFYVDRWLSNDAPPFQLTAILDGCKVENAPPIHGKGGGPLVVRKPIESASE
ncbi:hypothetical protein F0562_026472 [Nyssa sinensis]|uniref:PLAT domain-containing protein n=1 Tax=Nyssa sinensis TaxID=561372 RepID=A0A5J5BBI9_9ASTE|nr:hypothetical protein F0562_026472 [Nyssa sinensis]